jgi:tetratricopeptide (TPR) repeat protein
MRGTLLWVVVLAAWLTACRTAQAGLYSSWEAPFVGDYRKFLLEIGNLRGMASKETEQNPKSLRKQALERVALFLKKASTDGLTMPEQIDLSADYIRLGENDSAIGVLRDRELQQSRYKFLVMANLATAYINLQQYEDAEMYLREALQAWPKSWPGWTPTQLDWFRRAEERQHLLVRLRRKEPKQAQDLDKLFPKLRFVGPSGDYEAGVLAPAQGDNAPSDDLLLVEQLLYWMPNDPRLYWFMAELLNAKGDYRTAYALMDELSQTRNFRPPELTAHRRVLGERIEMEETIIREGARFHWEIARWSLAPIGPLISPGLGSTLDAVGWAGALYEVKEQPTKAEGPAITPDQPPPEAASSWTFDWRQIAVSFAAGAVIATLLSMQLRELRRRKQGAEAAVKGE